MGDCTLYRRVTVSAGYAWQTTSRLASQRWEVRELRHCWTWPVWRRKSYGMGRHICSFPYRAELLVLNGTLTGQRYINEVLQPVILPFVQEHHVVLQDDNARPHRARINSSCSRTMWIISIGLLDPLSCRQSSMFGTFSASVYDREFHEQERSKLWAQPCRRSGGGYPSYRLPDSSGVCVVVVWPA